MPAPTSSDVFPSPLPPCRQQSPKVPSGTNSDLNRSWSPSRLRLSIRNRHSKQSWDVVVFGTIPIRFGRTVGLGVELPACLYPLKLHREQNLRASGLHGQFTMEEGGWAVTDLHSKNGIRVGSEPLESGKPFLLAAKQKIEIAGALQLECRILATSTPEGLQINGAELPRAKPALLLRRIGNRTTLIYAGLQNRLQIGGGDPTLALTLPDQDDAVLGALWRIADTYYWETAVTAMIGNQYASAGDLTPLRADTAWKCGDYDVSVHACPDEAFR